MYKHLCRVESVSVGYQDRKILTFNCTVSIEDGGWLDVFNTVLDSYDKKRKHRVGSAYGCELIRQALDFFGVSNLNEVKDYYCYFLSEKENVHCSSDVLGIEQLSCSGKSDNMKRILKLDLEYLINE